MITYRHFQSTVGIKLAIYFTSTWKLNILVGPFNFVLVISVTYYAKSGH